MDVFDRARQVYLRSYQVWRAATLRFRPTERQRLFGLTIAIGGVCGLAAVAFHQSIRLVERFAIDRAFAASGDTWIGWVIGVPTVGALVAGILLHFVVPGARGSGIPQVKVAYVVKPRRLRLRDSVGKFFLGALQIGTGSSLGREGPTVQICAGIASALGRLVGVSAQNLRLLLPVGAAAGIAAAFNAPMAAVTFTIEEIVGTLDQTLLSGVIVAAALAAVVERSLLGEHPVFDVPGGQGLAHPSSLVLYAALGVAAAVVSIAFTEALLRLRGRFARASRIPGWLKPGLGGLATGCLAVAAMLGFGTAGVTGGGYDVLGQALSGNLMVDVLLALCAFKLLATVCSYSSGGAGGIFAPSLFIGGMLGGAFGHLDVLVFDHAHTEVGSFALVGMGAVFAGIVRAPITSVLIIIEMTNGYTLALPLMIANMTAYGLARHLRPTPIYDALLAQDGIDLHHKPAAPDTLEGWAVARIPLEPGPVVTFAENTRVEAMLQGITEAGRQDIFPVLDAVHKLVGLITVADLTALATEPEIEDLICAADLMRPPIALHADDPVQVALDLMQSAEVRELPVVDDAGHVLGLVDEAAIARAYLRARRHTTSHPVQPPDDVR